MWCPSLHTVGHSCPIRQGLGKVVVYLHQGLANTGLGAGRLKDGQPVLESQAYRRRSRAPQVNRGDHQRSLLWGYQTDQSLRVRGFCFWFPKLEREPCVSDKHADQSWWEVGLCHDHGLPNYISEPGQTTRHAYTCLG